MKKSLLFILTLFLPLLVYSQTIFINEIHYDNDGGDTGEGVEIAGPAGTDLSTFSIVGYNGSNGTSYSTTGLSGTISDQQNGYGTVWFAITGLQNGAPDGMALVNNGTIVIQFLSYEGSFTASDGPASGLTSEDIGVSEAGTTPIGHSLQLSGTGSVFTDFTWQAPAAGTQGQVNTGQTFSSGADTDPPVWTTDYPVMINVLDNKGTLVVNMDEPGVAYYIVIFAGATAPTADQVKAGVNYDTVNVLPTGNIIVEAANTDYFEIIEGASPEVSYDIWVVAEDGSFNLQSTPVMVNITTTPTRTLSFISPQDFDSYYLGDTIIFEWTSTNIDSVLIGAYNYEDDEIFPLTADEETGTLEPVFAELGSWSLVIPPGADVDSVDLLIFDYYDTTFYDRVFRVYLLDTLTPKIDELSPANGSDMVSPDAHFTISFDEEIFAGTGNFYLRAEDGTILETFDIAGLTIYYNSITLMPSQPLENGKTYYIDWDNGVVKDRKDLNFIGVTGDGAWKFATLGPDLFISEYIEGSGNNKAIEIYNPTSNTISLDNYRIAQSNNGGGWQYYHYFPDGAEIAAGGLWVILNSGTDPLLFDAADADEVLSYPSVVHHNGDDARGIEKTGDNGNSWVLIDVIGVPDEDPGTGWDVAGVSAATANHTLIRKITVPMGNLDWLTSAGTNTIDSEWLVAEQNYFDNLGLTSPEGSDNTELEAIMLYDTLLNNVTVTSFVDSQADTAFVQILFGMDSQLDSLVAILTLAEGATSSPASGDTLDFTDPVIFTVTAEDGVTSRDWTVRVVVYPLASSDAEILSFVIPGSVSDAIISPQETVTVTMPFGTDLTTLTPEISVSAGATINPESGVPQDFSSDVVYTVTAQDATTKDWTVTVLSEEALSASIYEIQYTTDPGGDSPLNGELVKTRGIITAIANKSQFDGYFIQAEEGAWNGIYVYDPDRDLTDNPQLGDSIEVVGTVDEYYNLTEIKNILEYTTHSTGNSLPGPVEVTTGNASAEEYEGVFMNLHAATCSNSDLGYGEVEMNDGSGAIRLDDFLFAYDPFVLDNKYHVTGVMHYSFDNWKLLPGSAADISDVTGIKEIDLSGLIRLYPNPNDGRFTIEIPAEMRANVEISIMDMTGKVIHKEVLNNASYNVLPVDLSNMANGLYFIKISDGKNTAIARFMKQ